MATIRLGPFELKSPLAKGGMGEVWRGVHVHENIPVAVKVVMKSVHRDTAIPRFRDEIRAVAGLDHPGVVMVLDHGEVPEDAVTASHGRLGGGSPWLAMELASGGTLAHYRGTLPWSGVKSVLLAVLDALGHAHARGVVHLDLKPSNVLVANRHDLRPGLKLSDFGIARALHGDDNLGVDGEMVGTPMYMAPEQISGDWRDFGPWTDLYALGCLVYHLSAGSSPYKRMAAAALLTSKLTRDPRPLEPRHAVPDGFDEWVRWLMGVDPLERFRCAADAADALVALGDPDEPDPTPEPGSPAALVVEATKVSLGETWRLGAPRAVERRTTTSTVSAPRTRAIPEDWRRTLPTPKPRPLVGAGLGLYGMRDLPVMGRDDEKDRLWAALRAVQDSGRSRLILIRGPAGTGKSSLVHWLTERAHELGAATWCKAEFSPELGPGRALQRLGQDYIRTQGMARDDVQTRVTRFLRSYEVAEHPVDSDEIAVLTELLAPASDAEVAAGHAVRLTTPREHYIGVRNTFFRAACERPLICWLDDVQWGPHGLGLARQVLETQDELPFPCLIVATLRSEALEEGTAAERRLLKILDHPEAEILELEPLGQGAHAELVRGLLDLSPSLAAQVEERTQGNPLFAVQLVGNWVQRGILELTPSGFVLAEGERATLPDDLHQLWSARMHKALETFPEHSQRYVEIAAVLGHRVDRKEWRRACDDPQGHFGDRFPGDERLRQRILQRLFEERLAVGSHDDWQFVHGMLRESLIRDAEVAGRLQAHHQACATLLESLEQNPDRVERLGFHLLAMGEGLRALPVLLRAASFRLQSVGPAAALAIHEVAERQMRVLPEDDPRWGRLWALEARIHDAADDHELAMRAVRRALEGASAHGWDEIRLDALHVLGTLLLGEKAWEQAETEFRRLNQLAAERGDRRFLGRARVGLAECSRRRGDHAGAAAQLERAVGDFLYSDEAAEIANCRRLQGRCAEGLGRLGAAIDFYEQARRSYQRLGAGLGAAECADRLGRLHRAEGRLAQAVTSFRTALQLLEALGSQRSFTTRMRMCVALVESGQVDEAGREAAGARSVIGLLPHGDRVAATYALRLVASATREDWTAWDATVPDLLANMPRSGPAPGLVAWLLRIAGEIARALGQKDRSQMALNGALAMFSAMGDREQIKELSP